MAVNRSPAPDAVRTTTVLVVIALVAIAWALLGLLVSDALSRPFVDPHERPTSVVHPVAPLSPTVQVLDPLAPSGSGARPPGWGVVPW